ncbi:MAG: LamB/YcsF family protein [Bacteroidetes bacterium]|nr:LamB/YcsF family protein [Bacteroidota bacterium]
MKPGQHIPLPVDLNCDMGEGMHNEESLMPFITSANIACGVHAGDELTMRKTVELAIKHDILIGAHPSFPDREHFGRTDMELSDDALYTIIIHQIEALKKITSENGTSLKHVKPHGALYNRSAKDMHTATIIARAVKEADPSLILFGLSGSCSITAAKAAGLTTAHEVFADRTYQDDGSLTPRSLPQALINEPEEAVKQVLQLLQQKTVTTVNGKTIPMAVDTICIHGDGVHATAIAKALYSALTTTIV